MKQSTKSMAWRLCCVGAAALSVLAFSPVVMPHGRSGPTLGGVPRALWAGIAVAVALVVLTWVGTRLQPGDDGEGGA